MILAGKPEILPGFLYEELRQGVDFDSSALLREESIWTRNEQILKFRVLGDQAFLIELAPDTIPIGGIDLVAKLIQVNEFDMVA